MQDNGNMQDYRRYMYHCCHSAVSGTECEDDVYSKMSLNLPKHWMPFSQQTLVPYEAHPDKPV